MYDISGFEKQFKDIVNSSDVPFYTKTFYSCCLESGIDDVDLFAYLLDVKDNLTESLSEVFIHYVSNAASIAWYMVTMTLYEEKIGDSELYIDYLMKCFDKGVDIKLIDDVQKKSYEFKEFKTMIENEVGSVVEDEFSINSDDVLSDQDSLNENILEVDSDDRVILSDVNDGADSSAFDILKNENSSYKRMLEERSNEVLELNNKNYMLSAENSQLKSELDSVKKDLKKFDSQKNLSEKKLEKLNKRIEALQKRNDEMRDEMNEMASSSEIDEYKRLNEELADKISHLTIEIDEKQKSNDELNDKISSIESDSANFENQCDLLAKENFELQNKISQLENDLYIAKSLVASDISSMNVPSDAEIDKYISENYDNSSFASNEEELDYDPADLISMVPDEPLIKERRSFFSSLVTRFKDKEFLRQTITQQNDELFIIMVKRNMPKDIFKSISEILKKGKSDIKRAELYRMIDDGEAPEVCLKFCEDAVA